MGLRVLTINIHLLERDGRVTEMTEYAPWPERCGIWEADRFIEHDGGTYEYIGCEGDVYRYRRAFRSLELAEA